VNTCAGARSFETLVEMAGAPDRACAAVDREECLASTRAYAAAQRAAIRARHIDGESGGNVVALLADAADALLRGIFRIALSFSAVPSALLSRVSLIALGGYGREELSPCSDLDVCLLYDGALDANIEALNGFLVPFLWDIGLQIGYAVRSVEEAVELARADLKAFTSFLESRLIAGNTTTFARLGLSIRELQSRELFDRFIRTKVRDRKEDLPPEYSDLYTPEPDIKENAGGLRDFHTALWLLRISHGVKSLDEVVGRGLITPEEHLDLLEALDFIWRVRNELHFHAGRADNQLSFPNQEHVARAFAYGSNDARSIQRLMQDYYAAARNLRAFLRIAIQLCNHEVSGPLLDATQAEPAQLQVVNGEIFAGTDDPNWFAENPARLMEVFWVSARRTARLSRPTEQLVRRNLHLVTDTFRSSDLARRFFLAICNRPLQAGHALRQMANSGLLERFIPEFGDIQGIIRYQDFHHYPVDEHTLRAIEALAQLPDLDSPAGTCLWEALENLSNPYILVMAILCHDLGKAAGHVHVEESVQRARAICERMGMRDDDVERIAFLVEHHLLMSDISQFRDTDDDDIVRDFVDTMKTEERVRTLFLLSYADLAAVGPGVWNDWKGALLMELYLKAVKRLLGHVVTVGEAYWTSPKARTVEAELRPALRPKLETHLRGLGQHYFAAYTPEQIAVHIDCVEQAKAADLAVHVSDNPHTNMSEVVVSTKDRTGLFSQIAGSFASQLIDVHSAALFTRPDGYVVDCFTVMDAHQPRPLTRRQVSAFEGVLRAVLLEGQDVAAYVEQSRRRLFALLKPPVPVLTRIEFDNKSSRKFTVIDVETGDRTGLLYDVTRAMASAGLDISSARIVTDARHVRDSFYVTRYGAKIETAELQAVVRDGIYDAIHPKPAVETKGEVQ